MIIDFDNIEVYEVLLKACNSFAVHPSASLESENFFRNLLEEYTNQEKTIPFEKWLTNQLDRYFKCINDVKPRWIQDPQWPFVNSLPMIFVGQFDIEPSEIRHGENIFHDTTSIYVFVGQKSLPVAVMQQY